MELGGEICVNIASDWWYMLLINELRWSKQCWKLSAKCCMILPLRKKGEKTQADYLTETPVGKVCPSSLGVCSPPVWAVWEESESSHGGLHLVVFLGMVTKPICLPTSSWVHRDPCATVHASSIFLWSFGCLSSDTWQRLSEVGEAEMLFGSSHSPCHSGDEEFKSD